MPNYIVDKPDRTRSGRTFRIQRRMSESQRRAYLKLQEQGLLARVERLREEQGLPETAVGEMAHTRAYIAAALDLAILSEGSTREFAKLFIDRSPAFSNSDTGMAAIQFEAYLVEKEEDLFKQFVETQLDGRNPTFLALFDGKIEKDALNRLETQVDFLKFTVLLEAGRVAYGEGVVADVTVLECKPTKRPEPTGTQPQRKLTTGTQPKVEVRDGLHPVTRMEYVKVVAEGGVSDLVFRYLYDGLAQIRIERGRPEAMDQNQVRWARRRDGYWLPQPECLLESDAVSLENLPAIKEAKVSPAAIDKAKGHILTMLQAPANKGKTFTAGEIVSAVAKVPNEGLTGLLMNKRSAPYVFALGALGTDGKIENAGSKKKPSLKLKEDQPGDAASLAEALVGKTKRLKARGMSQKEALEYWLRKGEGADAIDDALAKVYGKNWKGGADLSWSGRLGKFVTVPEAIADLEELAADTNRRIDEGRMAKHVERMVKAIATAIKEAEAIRAKVRSDIYKERAADVSVSLHKVQNKLAAFMFLKEGLYEKQEGGFSSNYGSWRVAEAEEGKGCLIGIEEGAYAVTNAMEEVEELLESIAEVYADLPAEFDMMAEAFLKEYAEDQGEAIDTERVPLDEQEPGDAASRHVLVAGRDETIERNNNLRLLAAGRGREGGITDNPFWTVSVSFDIKRKGAKSKLQKQLARLADRYGGEEYMGFTDVKGFGWSYAFEEGDANTSTFVNKVKRELNAYAPDVEFDERDVTYPAEEGLEEGFKLLPLARYKTASAEEIYKALRYGANSLNASRKLADKMIMAGASKTTVMDMLGKLTAKFDSEGFIEALDIPDDHMKGLKAWVRDYKTAKKHGNERMMKGVKANIDRQLKALKIVSTGRKKEAYKLIGLLESDAVSLDEAGKAVEDDLDEAIKEGTSEYYFVKEVLPALRKMLPSRVPPRCKLRGRGRVDKKTGVASFIVDCPNPKGTGTLAVEVFISGSHMTADDGEFGLTIKSPWGPGTMSAHRKMSRNPAKDAATIAEYFKAYMSDYVKMLPESDTASLDEARPIPTRNTEYGFYGTVRNSLDVDTAAKKIWDRMFKALAKRFPKYKAEQIRDFLDSAPGRHFADELADTARPDNSEAGLLKAIPKVAAAKWLERSIKKVVEAKSEADAGEDTLETLVELRACGYAAKHGMKPTSKKRKGAKKPVREDEDLDDGKVVKKDKRFAESARWSYPGRKEDTDADDEIEEAAKKGNVQALIAYWKKKLKGKTHPWDFLHKWAKKHPEAITDDPKAWAAWMHKQVFGVTPAERKAKKEKGQEVLPLAASAEEAEALAKFEAHVSA